MYSAGVGWWLELGEGTGQVEGLQTPEGRLFLVWLAMGRAPWAPP